MWPTCEPIQQWAFKKLRFATTGKKVVERRLSIKKKRRHESCKEAERRSWQSQFLQQPLAWLELKNEYHSLLFLRRFRNLNGMRFVKKTSRRWLIDMSGWKKQLELDSEAPTTGSSKYTIVYGMEWDWFKNYKHTMVHQVFPAPVGSEFLWVRNF